MNETNEVVRTETQIPLILVAIVLLLSFLFPIIGLSIWLIGKIGTETKLTSGAGKVAIATIAVYMLVFLMG